MLWGPRCRVDDEQDRERVMMENELLLDELDMDLDEDSGALRHRPPDDWDDAYSSDGEDGRSSGEDWEQQPQQPQQPQQQPRRQPKGPAGKYASLPPMDGTVSARAKALPPPPGPGPGPRGRPPPPPAGSTGGGGGPQARPARPPPPPRGLQVHAAFPPSFRAHGRNTNLTTRRRLLYQSHPEDNMVRPFAPSGRPRGPTRAAMRDGPARNSWLAGDL